MLPDDRIERLEHRLQQLEELVLDLQAELRAKEVPPAGTLAREPAETAPPLPRPPVAPPPEPPQHKPAVSTPRPSVGTEQWFGQRGLLAAGVLLLILAAGYFLKLAFDRGWISPLLRCVSGGTLGLAVSAAGWRLHQRGLRTYGAALIGCGAAMAYLAVWAAASLFDLLPDTVALGMMALLSVATFGAAWVVNVEALAAAAALGAFLAPLVVGRGGNANVLLLYSFFLAGGLGAVALKRWRLTTFLIALSFFVLGFVAAGSGTVVETNALMYGVIGAAAGLWIGLNRRWVETRFLSFWGGWVTLWLAAWRLGADPLVAAGGIVLAGVIWWHAWRDPSVWPDEDTDGRLRPESLYFYATPLWLAWAMPQVAPEWFARAAWAPPLMIALAYVAGGYLRRRVPFAVVGSTAALFTALAAWGGVPAVWALLALALLWAALDHGLERADGRWYALLAAGAALVHLTTVDAYTRPRLAPAFVDAWALSVWLATAALAALAAGLWRPVGAPTGVTVSRPQARLRYSIRDDLGVERLAPGTLWVLSGSLLFLGVSHELARFFQQTAMTPANARLAGGLAVSAWWALFAAALVMVGFLRNRMPVRVAGLIVSGLAVAKVLLFDLSELDALYRVASVLILGLVSLGVAYLYHRQAASAARTAAGGNSASPAA